VTWTRTSLLRSTAGRLAVAGAATLTTALSVTPPALADDLAPETAEAPPVEETPPAQEAPPVEDAAPAEKETPPAEEAPAPETGHAARIMPTSTVETDDPPPVDVEPHYGFQKFRVGVKIADGSWVPAGTTTAGSTFTVTVDNGDGPPSTFTCTTAAPADATADGASYCPSSSFESTTMRAAAVGGVDVVPEPIPGSDIWLAEPGATVTVTQTGTAPGLRRTASSGTVDACKVDDGPVCWMPGGGQVPLQSTVLFANTGLPPKAANDSVSTDAGRPVTISVLGNDDTGNGAPLTALETTAEPKHGRLTRQGNRFVYTPDDGFAGVDRFRYRLSTANGSANATVTITVRGTSAVAASLPRTDDPLPDTGGEQPGLLGLAALLVGGGAWLVSRGRPATSRART